MYLVELHPLTGLVKVEGEFDGIRAVKEFRDIINDAELGIVCMTAIALTADYLTPIAYYRDEDKPYKAMEMATGGNRRAFPWACEAIQNALKKYEELQYNPTIEEKKTLDEMLLNKLKEIGDEKENQKRFVPIEKANEENIEDLLDEYYDIKKFMKKEVEFKDLTKKELKSLIRKANLYVIDPTNEKRKEQKREKDEERMGTLFKQLGTIKDLIKAFNKNNENNDVYADGPVRNGYKLTRLEEKAIDKNSFYHKGR